MVIIELIGQKGGFNLRIRVCLLMSRASVHDRLGADLVYMRGLVNALDTF
jgi:hypothetical protein